MSTPHRFTQTSFLKYETIIQTIVSHFPSPTIFTPPASPETFSCRLRDAMRSFKDNNWPSLVNRERFLEVYSAIVVSIQKNGKVVAGPKNTVPDAITPNVSCPSTIQNPSDEVLNAFILLLHMRFITPVTISGVSSERLDQLTSAWDVAYTVNQNGTTTLV